MRLRSLIAGALALLVAAAPAVAPAASLTPPNLTAATSIANQDLMLVWPNASNGPLKQIQWSVLQSQMQTALGSTYLQVSNNLSDVQSAATARANLGLASAAQASTGTAGHVLGFLDGANTVSGAWTWTGKLNTAASTTGGAGFNIAPGTAPTSPINGDCWLTTSALFCRVNGATQQLLVNTNNLSDLSSATSARSNLGLGTAATANTGTSGSALGFLNAANTWSAAQSLSGLTLSGITGATQCIQVNSSGVVSGTGTACGSGSGSVGTTGTPASGNLTQFSGTSTITNGNLSGDCTTSGTLAITCTKTSGVAFGTFATANAATPPAIGSTTPAAGAFTTLSASSTVSGTGFSTYLASPPAIGGTTPAAGTFAPVTSLRTSIGVTSTDGVVLQNTTPAALGAQQWAPRLRWTGRGWGTGGSTSQSVDIIAELQPVQGTAPTGNLVFSQSINGGAYGALLTLPSGGGLNLASGTYQIAGSQITCSALSNATSACSTAIGTSGAVLPLLNTANTWSATQSFPNGSLTLTELATQAVNTIVANNTGSTASPTAVSVSSFCGTTGTTFACGNDSRFVGPTQNSQSAAYTLVLGDGGGQIYHPSADTTARIWTVPANSSVAFQVGAKVELINDCSAGAITLNITTDTLVWFPAGTTGSRTISACGAATLTKVTSTRWVLTGVGIS